MERRGGGEGCGGRGIAGETVRRSDGTPVNGAGAGMGGGGGNCDAGGTGVGTRPKATFC